MKYLVLLFFLTFCISGLDAQRYGDKTPVFLEWSIFHGEGGLQRLQEILYGGRYKPANDQYTPVRYTGGRVTASIGMPNSNLSLGLDFGVSSLKIPGDTVVGGHYGIIEPDGFMNRVAVDQERISLGLHVCLHAFEEFSPNLFVTIGFRYGMVGGANVQYRSTEPAFDLEVQDALNRHLEVRNDFSLVAGAGFEIRLSEVVGFTVRAEYEHGLSDVIGVTLNDYEWRDHPGNFTTNYHAAVGLKFRLYEK